MCVCVYESLSVRVSMSAAGEGLHCRYSENEVARRPPKPPTGGQAVTAQLIFEGI